MTTANQRCPARLDDQHAEDIFVLNLQRAVADRLRATL